MLRALARFLGIWLAAATLVMAVVDGAKSIAASTIVLTPFSETWSTMAGLVRPATEAAEGTALPWPLDLALAWLSTAPTVAVLGVLSFVLLTAGRRRPRPVLGREFAA